LRRGAERSDDFGWRGSEACDRERSDIEDLREPLRGGGAVDEESDGSDGWTTFRTFRRTTRTVVVGGSVIVMAIGTVYSQS
jgi:hypothetical protein